MKHPERIEEYLEHIVQAIEHATSFMQSVDSPELLERDYRTQAAVVRCIETIGEAASKIQQQAPEVIKAHPEIPWLQMRAMRNKVIHDYFDVEPGVVWSTVKNDLPSLKRRSTPC